MTESSNKLPIQDKVVNYETESPLCGKESPDLNPIYPECSIENTTSYIDYSAETETHTDSAECSILSNGHATEKETSVDFAQTNTKMSMNNSIAQDMIATPSNDELIKDEQSRTNEVNVEGDHDSDSNCTETKLTHESLLVSELSNPPEVTVEIPDLKTMNDNNSNTNLILSEEINDANNNEPVTEENITAEFVGLSTDSELLVQNEMKKETGEINDNEITGEENLTMQSQSNSAAIESPERKLVDHTDSVISNSFEEEEDDNKKQMVFETNVAIISENPSVNSEISLNEVKEESNAVVLQCDSYKIENDSNENHVENTNDRIDETATTYDSEQQHEKECENNNVVSVKPEYECCTTASLDQKIKTG